jgi:hypothetical protein
MFEVAPPPVKTVEAHGSRIALEEVAGWPMSFVIRLPEPATQTVETPAAAPDSIVPLQAAQFS